MANSLETLLRRIRDGVSSSEEMERARTLVLADDRLPAELREVVLLDEEEAPSDAAGLLSVLGADDLGALLAEAIEAEASAGPDAPDAVELEAQEHDPTWAAIRDVLVRELQRRSAHVELAEVVVRQMPELRDWVWGPVLAEAVYLHAGRIDVAAAVVAELGLDAGLDVAAAVRAEAGEVDVSGLVMREVGIGAAVPQLAEAVRAEAGTVDVTDAVARALALESPVVMPAAVVAPPNLAPAANNRRFWAAAAFAMAAGFLAMVVGTQVRGPGTVEDPNMVFAHADEVVFENLSFEDDAIGMVDTVGEDGTVVVWLEDEDA